MSAGVRRGARAPFSSPSHARHRPPAVLQLFERFRPGEKPPPALGPSRDYNVDLVPKFIMVRGGGVRWGALIFAPAVAPAVGRCIAAAAGRAAGTAPPPVSTRRPAPPRPHTHPAQANGNLVKVLVHTDVTKYLEFKAVDGSYVLNKQRVEKVPVTDWEALKSPLMGLFEKRRAAKFFGYCQQYDERSPQVRGGCGGCGGSGGGCGGGGSSSGWQAG